MSVRLSKRLSSKKKKPPKGNAQAEVLHKLGLEAFWTTPLDPASMLDICIWTLENQAPLETKDLPNAFLQRLWLLSPDARSPCCKALHDVRNNANKSPDELINGFGEGSQCAINPLDLVTAVFMSANSFLQQEMTVRMLQCHFAVPLVLPNVDPEEPSRFLLWPLRGAVSQWRSHFPDSNRKVLEGDLASTYMPVVSCVKLGHCVVSKSQVLNNVINGLRSPSDTFVHRGMDGGQLPRRLSNGLIEIGWCLPTGDTARDVFPVPLVISNLPGNASTHKKFLSLLCEASSAVVVFCGNLREKDKQLLASCKYMACKLILIDLSDAEKNENRVVGFVGDNLEQYIGFTGGSVLQGKDLSVEELANRLRDTLKDLLPDKLKLVTLEAAAKLAEVQGLNVDEQAVCKKAMATVELVLGGLDEGFLQFKEKQFPLQGHLWSKLAEIEKEERRGGNEIDPQLQKRKQEILVEFSRYKMTPAMKVFTDSLFLSDTVERTYFLSWMKLRLRQKQIEKRNSPQDLFTYLQTEKTEDMPEHCDELQNGTNDYQGDTDSFFTDSTFEEENNEELPINTEQQVSEQQFEISQELEHSLQKSTEQTDRIEPLSQQKEHLESTRDPVAEQQLHVTSNEKKIQSEEQLSVTVFEDQNPNLEFGENGTTSCQWKQLDTPELTQLAGPEMMQLAGPELIQQARPELTGLDEPELTQLDEPELTQLAGPELIQLAGPELIQQARPELTQLDESELTQLDEPELTQLDEPELTQLAGPELTHVDESELTHVDGPELIQVAGPELIQVAGPELIQLAGPELTQLAGPELIQVAGSKLTRVDESVLTELDVSELTELDESELTLPKSDSTSSAEQQMCQDVFFEHPVASCSQPLETELSSLGLEHFLREMGLIFELTHMSPRRGSHNVLRLPSLATDLLLCGIPLELMDGDASYIPLRWLGCVFAELKHRLPQERCRTRVLANIGVHHGRNGKVFSALFGVKFPEGRQKSTRGVYMIVLFLPDNLRKDLECDFLLLIDVEGLCSMSPDNNRNTLIQDNEMATVATGLSDVLLQNISSHLGTEFEANFTVIVNALLRIKECGPMPICQLLTQDDEINSLLHASQLRRVLDMLQTKTCGRGTINHHYAKTTSCITGVKWPWYNMSLSEPIDTQYSQAVFMLKQNLFGALKKCAATSKATGLPEFMSRLCSIWDAVKAESFSIGLQNTDKALDFSLLCTELSPWEDGFLEHMESWLKGATKKIFATKVKALDAVILNGLLSELKDEAREEVKTEVDKLRSKVEDYFKKDNHLKINTFRPIVMSNMDDHQKQVTKETLQRLETISESHYSSTQLDKLETLLEKEQESKLHTLVEKSKSTKVLLQDTELEAEFEGMWSKTLSNFDFRPSETDDITPRVAYILKKNLIRLGLQKHWKKLEGIGQIQTSCFQVYDEHFGYRSRLKHMFADSNRQRLEAQQVACKIIEAYKQFVADKSSLLADFSDSYITQLLKNVEKTLKDKSLEIRSAFEVDLKVYLCSAACRDFQKLHDRYAKDSELLTCITATKSTYLAEFIYQFRKRDQCQRVARAFTSMVIKPTVLDYIYKPMGMRIVQEIQGKDQQFQSPRAFHQSLLEELIEEDRFESFLEYLLSYEIFRLRKIQQRVVTHLSESNNLYEWRCQRLGEIVGKVAVAVSQMAEGTNGVLSDTKPLLERVCLTLESDGDVDVSRASLEGPFFSITTKWDHFVSCLMEFLAAMRLDLVQDFSKNVEITQLLQCLSIQPQDSLVNRVRGCDRQCPLCRTPCELEEKGHEVHRALLHRPKGMLPPDSGSLSCISCPESMTESDTGMSKDTQGMSVACSNIHALYPDWSFSPEDSNSQTPRDYWRFVLARFNERFAKEYKQEPANVPEEWKQITKEEALSSLKKAFLTGQCY